MCADSDKKHNLGTTSLPPRPSDISQPSSSSEPIQPGNDPVTGLFDILQEARKQPSAPLIPPSQKPRPPNSSKRTASFSLQFTSWIQEIRLPAPLWLIALVILFLGTSIWGFSRLFKKTSSISSVTNTPSAFKEMASPTPPLPAILNPSPHVTPPPSVPGREELDRNRYDENTIDWRKQQEAEPPRPEELRPPRPDDSAQPPSESVIPPHGPQGSEMPGAPGFPPASRPEDGADPNHSPHS